MVGIRYPWERRSDVDKLKRILVPVMASPGSSNPVASSPMAGSGGGLQVPLGELANFRIIRGATSSDCPVGGAFFTGRFFLAPIPAQLQYEHCGLGRDYRLGRT